ncbi:MAG: hypothetical protein IJ312_03565 [Treponema sp.]|nr:hypothetical protein [Treponema sp.]
MPGLNQLRKFSNDIKNLGDEVKIRAQRGEKPAVVPLPEGISEADDSEDFVLGLPENNLEENSQTDTVESLDVVNDVLESGSTNDSEVPNLDSILNITPNTNDEVPDLSDFLEESSSADTSTEPEEIPLEDLDLESLLKSSSEMDENVVASDDNDSDHNITEPDFASDADLLNTLETFTDSDFNSDKINEEKIEFPSESLDSIESSNEINSEIFDNDFDFSGEPINLNDDLPEEIIKLDGDFNNKTSVSDDLASISSEESLSNNGNNEILSNQNDELSESLDNFSSDLLGSTADIDFTPSGDFDIPDFDIDTNASENAENSDESILSSDSESSAEPSIENLFSTSDLDNDFSMEVPIEKTEDIQTSSDDLSSLFDTSNLDKPDATQDVPPETFDISDIENLDFSSEGSSASFDEEFPVTTANPQSFESDDFLLDENSFEIPGFSDTATAQIGKKGRPIVDVADFSQATTGKPKNTLTEEEYAKFKENLISYPLNLRLAIEELIVKNEFTDDAVFEVILKVLNKTSARQVATHLEKMLDISIDVPRDYEKRSVAQYEAYKQSFQYQLKNRIIPGGIAAVILCMIGYVLFHAGLTFVYKPIMANVLYKQGYTLLENNEYPQSEVKFIEAVNYKPVKKWFFKYARGYRTHKQYERASQMYLNILGVFNHDKEGGLEWAKMELYERTNFERAEDIVRRQVLDYHINLPDGILLLGDIFLEWADYIPEKYELAREQYATLIQLYGPTDLYMSRMMRYFIRTDKLRNVLELKSRFYPNEKSLCAEDWTELSGYLLDKLYGKLSRADEYLRSSIEDVRAMLEIAVKKDTSNPVGRYNIARYFVHNGNYDAAKRELQISLDLFKNLEIRTKKNTYREINASRLLGDLYAENREYLKAQEVYTDGINLYKSENKRSNLEGDENIGKLYASMGDIEYFISGDMDAALENYDTSIRIKNDTPSLNYRIGVIRYGKQEYDKALASFIKANEVIDSDENLLLSLGNVLSLRGDNFAAQGYYTHLLNLLDQEKARHLMLFPQDREDDNNLVDLYLKASNNLGVTLYRIARQTGDSKKNAEALVRLSDSIRAWDALTRNQTTMIRLEGSNLAAQNSKYITHSKSDFEPAIYTEIPKILVGEKELK